MELFLGGGATCELYMACYILSSSYSSGVCMHAKLLRSCPTLCDSMDCSPPGSSVHGILRARMLEWVSMPSSRESSGPRDRNCVSYISRFGRRVLCH